MTHRRKRNKRFDSLDSMKRREERRRQRRRRRKEEGKRNIRKITSPLLSSSFLSRRKFVGSENFDRPSLRDGRSRPGMRGARRRGGGIARETCRRSMNASSVFAYPLYSPAFLLRPPPPSPRSFCTQLSPRNAHESRARRTNKGEGGEVRNVEKGRRTGCSSSSGFSNFENFDHTWNLSVLEKSGRDFDEKSALLGIDALQVEFR